MMEDSIENHNRDQDDQVPRDPDEIEAFELDSSLRGLSILGDDPYLRMQAINLAYPVNAYTR